MSVGKDQCSEYVEKSQQMNKKKTKREYKKKMSKDIKSELQERCE